MNFLQSFSCPFRGQFNSARPECKAHESLDRFVLSPGYRVTGLIMNKSFTDHIQMILPLETYLSIASLGLDQNTRWKGFLRNDSSLQKWFWFSSDRCLKTFYFKKKAIRKRKRKYMFSFFSFLHFLLSYFSTTSKENVMMETGNSEKFFFIFSSPISRNSFRKRSKVTSPIRSYFRKESFGFKIQIYLLTY